MCVRCMESRTGPQFERNHSVSASHLRLRSLCALYCSGGLPELETRTIARYTLRMGNVQHAIKMPENEWKSDNSQVLCGGRKTNNENAFVCRFCQRVFRKSYNLLIHERSHEDHAKCHYDVFRVRSSLQELKNYNYATVAYKLW